MQHRLFLSQFEARWGRPRWLWSKRAAIVATLFVSCKGDITRVEPVASLDVTPAAAPVQAGGSTQLSAVPRDASGRALYDRSVSWTSSAPDTAAVDGTGLVSGKLTGAATITATAEGVSGAAVITVSPGPAAALHFTVQPGAIVAGAVISPPIEVRASDAFGNTATSFTGPITVALAANPGGATLSGTTTVFATAGVAQFSDLMLDKSGSGYTLQASANGLTAAASTAFTITGGAPAQLAFSVQPSTVSAGASIAPAVQVVARDTLGNTATAFTGAVTLALGVNPNGGTLTGTLTQSAVGGVATFTGLSLDKAGPGYCLTASATGLRDTSSTCFAVTAGTVSASRSTLGIAPATITASGGASAASITVTARDAFDNPVSGATVVLSATGSGNSLTQPAGLTDGTGVATGTLSSTGAETKSVSAVTNGVAIADTASLVVIAAPAKVLAFSMQPSATGAGESIAPAIQVAARDSFGNPVTSFTGSVTVAIGTNAGSGTLSGTKTKSAVAGVATFSDLSIDKLGNGYTLTAAATGLTGAASVAFDITTGGVSAAHSSVAVAPGTITAGGGTNVATVTVTARDAFDNSVSGATVVLSATGLGNSLTQPAGSTDANGVATGTLSSTGAGTKSVSAKANGVAIADTASLVVTAAAAKVLAFTVEPSSAGAGASIAPAVQVAARDSFGNLVGTYTGGVTVAIGTNAGSGTLSGTKTKSAVAGVATFSDLSIDNRGNGYTLTAAAAGLTGATSATFDITAGPVSGAQSSVAVAPSVIRASAGDSLTTITVTARDGFGNPVPGVTVILAASGTGDSLTQPAGPTDANGVATGTLSSAASGTKTVSATADGVAIIQQPTVTVNSAPATVLVLTAQPRDTVAGAVLNDPGGVKVSARDAFGNTDDGYTQTITLAFGTNAGSGTLAGLLARPAVAGVATFTGLSIDKTGTGYTLRATATGFNAVTSGPFNITPGPVAGSPHSMVSASPTSIQASNGSSLSTVSVTVRDLLDNPIPGATVVLSGSGIVISQPPPTDAQGLTAGTISATAAGTKMVTVTANSVALTPQLAITVTVGPVSATHSTVLAAPDTIEASSGGITTNVVVTAKDAFDNVIADSAVTVSATGTGSALSQQNGVTDGSGVYANAIVSGTTVGSVIVSATVAGVAITQKDTIAVIPGEVSASQSTLVTSPSTVTASSGSGGATITVTARDDQGNVIPGANVTLSASGGGNAITQPGVTDANGVATGRLRSTLAETKIVSAAIAGTGIGQADTVTVIPAAADTTVFTVEPSGATVGIVMAPPVKVEIHDQFGNLLSTATNNVTLTLSSNPSGATLSGGGSVAAVNGVASFAGVSLDKVGTGYRLTASASSVPHSDVSSAFSVTSGMVSASQTSVVAAPTTISASTGSSASTITVTARDAGGNPISGATVVLSATGNGNAITQPGPTNATGVATGTLSSTGAGPKTITAVVNGISIDQQPAVTVNAGTVSGTQSTIVASPAAIVQSTGTSTIIVTAMDAFGNPVSGATVVLAATGSGNTLTQPSGSTNGSGVASGTLGSSNKGNKVVTATAAGVALTHSDTVTVIAQGSSVVLVGAGDIAKCGKQDDEATAGLVTGVLNATPGAEVITLGDNVYEDGTATEFANCYDPSWGVFKNVTHPSAGNHDYNTSGAVPYYNYFGAAAGPAGQGYYSYDFGAWHVIVLNSEISTSANSPQLQWLQSDLASHSNVCTLAYWHQPLYSSVGGSTGTTGATISSARPFWDVLYAAGVDLVLNGHRHVYERLARMAPDGTPDPTNGIREIIVGTGGDSGGDLTNIFPTSEVREGHTYGVIKLTLSQSSYSWQFLPAEGGTFTDSGTEVCH
jgi:Bacterial Ig-like domain (group 1)/Invasin, domain 3/Bacterial Ig-like domain (group 2)/Calcineurin-like phosphoesterase